MNDSITLIGWREWVSLPEFKIDWIKAKVDTGARTSALHAYFVETFNKQGIEYVRFGLHPFQKNEKIETICETRVADVRQVTDSGGHVEERIVVVTPVRIGGREWPIEVTLTNRETMGFRMLLGRTAFKNYFYVDPSRAYLTRAIPTHL